MWYGVVITACLRRETIRTWFHRPDAHPRLVSDALVEIQGWSCLLPLLCTAPQAVQLVQEHLQHRALQRERMGCGSE